MKRVKCYGRMKTACINTAERKVFYGDNEPSLWNFSFGSDDDDFVLPKGLKKTPCFREKVDSAVDRPKSLSLFSSCESPETDRNKENFPPVKKKLGKKGKSKKPVKKKTRAAKDKLPMNVKEPRWSTINEHRLHVEGNSEGNKRHAIPSSVDPFKQSYIENQLLDDEPSAKQLRSNASVSSKAVAGGSGLKLQSVNNTYNTVDLGETSSGRQLRSKANVLCRKISSGYGRRLRASHHKSIPKSHQSSDLKDSLTHNSTNFSKILPANEIRTEIHHVNEDQNASNVTINKEKSDIHHDSDINQSSILKDSLNCKSVGIAEISQRSKIQTKVSHQDTELDRIANADKLPMCHFSNNISQNNVLKKVSLNCNFSSMTEILQTNEKSNWNAESGVSDAMTHAGKKRSSICLDRVNPPALDSAVDVCSNISRGKKVASEKSPISRLKKRHNTSSATPDMFQIRKSNSMLFEITNMGSWSKNISMVTSTPTIASRMRLPHKMSMFNLSQICAPENGSNLSKRANSFFSKSSICLRSEMYDNRISVSFIPKTSRSLVQMNSMKPCCELNHLSISSQTQTESKSRKSYSCIEKIASDKSLLSYSNINQSLSVMEKLIELCNQDSIEPFAEAYDWNLTRVQKVGEGTYGEVFMLSLKKKASVIKIIPVSQDDTSTWLNIETVYSEVKVSQCLSNLRDNKLNKTMNFNKLNSVHFVKGCYPTKLLTAWDTFSTVKSCYNIRPDCFDNDQLYVILDMEHGGTDLSCFVMKNAVEAESILKQVTISLAIAEETHLFEHRDLHLGNILVQRTKKKNVSYVLRGQSISIPSQGVMVTIIDFTLSRIFDSGCVYYNNLADDKSLFEQSGDYQFDIYRATRDHLKNQWQEGSLFSNVLWLTFLCVKATEYRYLRPTSLAHLKSFNNIAVFQNNLKSCKSAFDCLTMCKLLSSVPKSDQSLESILKGKAVFVDRKSFQKSKCSIIRS